MVSFQLKHERIFLLILGLIILPFFLIAQIEFKKLENFSKEQLENELAETKLFIALKNAERRINEESLCGKQINKAKKTRQDLITLNKTFAKNPTPAYRERALQLKEENKQALKDYKSCFSSHIAGIKFTGHFGDENLPTMGDYEIYSYDSHKNKLESLKEWFGEEIISNIDHYHEAIVAELSRKKASYYVVVMHVTGEAEVSRNGSTSWENLSIGINLNAKDRIRTGKSAIVEIDVKATKNNALKSASYIGPNSNVKVGDFFGAALGPSPAVELYLGIMRIIKPPGSGLFSVRAGTTVVGIRGTEVTIEKDSTFDMVNVFLHHGDAYVETRGQKTTLVPGSSLTIDNGITSSFIELPQSAVEHITSLTTPSEFTENTTLSNSEINTAFESMSSLRDELLASSSGDYQNYGDLEISVKAPFRFEKREIAIPEASKKAVKDFQYFSQIHGKADYTIQSVEYYDDVQVNMQANIERLIDRKIKDQNVTLVDRESDKLYFPGMDQAKEVILKYKTADQKTIIYQGRFFQKGQRVYVVSGEYQAYDRTAEIETLNLLNLLKMR